MASPWIHHQHQRQQSTPTPYEDHNLPSSPAYHPHQSRFGASLTASPDGQYMHRMGQDDVRQVGITNPGHQPQHHTQVAQQQCQARPGHEQSFPYYNNSEAHEDSFQDPRSQPLIQQISLEEFRSMQHQQLDAQLDSIMHSGAQESPAQSFPFVKVERSRSDMGPQYAPHNESNPERGHMRVPSYLDCDRALFQEQQRPRSSQSMVLENRMSLPQQWPAFTQRPYTPPLQGSPASYSPMTPAMSPHMQHSRPGTGIKTPSQRSSPSLQYNTTVKPARRRQSPHKSRPQSQVLQPAFEYECDPNATVKPTAQSRSLRGDLFMPDNEDQLHSSLPSPPSTAPVRHSRKFDVTALPDETALDDVPKLGLLPRAYSSNLAYFPPDHGLNGNEPVFASAGTKQEHSNEGHNFEPQTPSTSAAFHSARSSIDFGAFGSPDGLIMSTVPMSISGLNLDEHVSIEDTGISTEEVNSYMVDDPSNSKTPWLCTYPECGKRFGRRENIRSHVQTHLNDRQFRCIHCSKRFVRQHDLKRHSKIHTKEKPYQCACGNGFARQDALTRHRQRGICTGSFEGIVRTPVKRGRPRKHRPNDEDRRDKAARTRKRNDDKAYCSSVSGTSESSSFESPSPLLNQMELDPAMTDSDFVLLSGMGQYAPVLTSGPYSEIAPMSPYASSRQSSPHRASSSEADGSPGPTQQDEAFAPSSFQYSQDLSNSAITVSMSQLSHHMQQSCHGSPIGSQLASHPGSPPELSHSSPPGSARLVDHDSSNSSYDNDSAAIKLTDTDDQVRDDDLARLLASADTSAGAFETVWNDSSFFNLDKSFSGASEGNDPSLATFRDEPLFTTGNHAYS